MLSPINDPNIPRRLFERYFAEAPPKETARHASSHWQYLSSKFRAEVDSSGDLILLDGGEGLGPLRWSGWAARVADAALAVGSSATGASPRGAWRNLRLARQICKAVGFDATSAVYRQACTAALIQRYLPQTAPGRRTRFLMIGDGRGLLGLLLARLYPGSRICFVDLGRTLLFTAYYAQRVFPDAVHSLSRDRAAKPAADFVFCPAEEVSTIDAMKFDVAISVSAMQEMTGEVVSRYFEFLRTHLMGPSMFYCIGREMKRMRGGEVSEFLTYPWVAGDRILVDGECPWYRYYMGRRHSSPSARILGLPVAFLNRFEGRTLHRLVTMATWTGSRPASPLAPERAVHA